MYLEVADKKQIEKKFRTLTSVSKNTPGKKNESFLLTIIIINTTTSHLHVGEIGWKQDKNPDGRRNDHQSVAQHTDTMQEG